MEDRDRQTLKQDLQDEQDGLQTQEQSPIDEGFSFIPICFSILSILSILSNFNRSKQTKGERNGAKDMGLTARTVD
jgi:hypothetical protein